MKKDELIELLDVRDMDTSGTKADLIARLQEAHQEALEELAPEEDAVIEEPETPEDTGMQRPAELDEWELQVDALYHECLGRQADPQGLYHYKWELKTGNRTLEQLKATLLASDEAKALKDLEDRSAHDEEE